MIPSDAGPGTWRLGSFSIFPSSLTSVRHRDSQLPPAQAERRPLQSARQHFWRERAAWPRPSLTVLLAILVMQLEAHCGTQAGSPLTLSLSGLSPLKIGAVVCPTGNWQARVKSKTRRASTLAAHSTGSTEAPLKSARSLAVSVRVHPACSGSSCSWLLLAVQPSDSESGGHCRVS